jgi:uncharacterized CHY-type Zn-finger protein
MIIHGINVKGEVMDSKTRCEHYHLDVDIVAIKFKCCATYYSCCRCHAEEADHEAEVWKKDEFDEKAILCGHCGTELTVNEYLNSISTCPMCKSNFNPRCKNHFHLYFEV